METINLSELYKDKVVRIWQDYANLPIFNEPEKDYRKSPILPETIQTEALLFIGCNPSFRKKSFISDENKLIEFYNHDPNNNVIDYFKKIQEVANYCDHSMAHIDLFFIRETNQKLIEELSVWQKEFLNAQLDVSFDIIHRSKPKVIVVSNALASEFFGKRKAKHGELEAIWRSYKLDFKTDFDNEIGTYRIDIDNNRTPIIFSGMFSGQRALDIGSLERLKWQVKMILDKVK